MNLLAAFFLSLLSCYAESEILDFVTVYRLNTNDFTQRATKEYHRQTNAISIPLKTNRGHYVDTVEGMVPLQCIPADNACQWNKSDGWEYHEVDVSEDFDFAINVDERINTISQAEYQSCDDDNGGCQAFCTMLSGKPICSCPNGYEFQSNDMSCKHDSYEVFTESGELSYKVSSGHEWLIIPPKNSTIYLDIEAKGYSRECYVSIEEIMSTENSQQVSKSTIPFENMRVMSPYILKIRVEIRRYHGYETAEITAKFDIKRKHLILKKPNGILNFTIIPLAPSACVSVVYNPPTGRGSLDLNGSFSNGTHLTSSLVYELLMAQKWILKRFLIAIGRDFDNHINLSIDVSGLETTLHSISGCSPYGKQDITVLGQVPSLPHPLQRTSEFELKDHRQYNLDCHNGGKYNNHSGYCDCPMGFIGDKCEEGCGPNYYGHDCKAVCSNFQWGCSGMIFCKQNLPCLCAPGFHGKHCNISCEAGFYGPSCRELCGKCERDPCNVFTGKCDTGCEPGFYPPDCHSTYKFSEIEPDVIYQDLNVATIRIDSSHTNGNGNIKFFQIQYKLQGEMKSDSWIELQPQRLLNLQPTVNITDLQAGAHYEIRVIYIDRDGSSYQGNLVPTKLFSTFCTVPTTRKYIIESQRVTDSSFVVSWKYLTEENDCPAIGYIVVLQRNWQKVQHSLASNETSYEFKQLLPGLLYEVRIKATTSFGEAPFSYSFGVTTRDSAPLHVTDLQVLPGGSDKLLVSWSPPRYTGGSITEYILEYKCVKLLACSESCEPMNRTLIVTRQSVLIDGLQPHARYAVKVAGKSQLMGPFSVVYGATEDAGPSVAPQKSDTPIISSTNTSVTVEWLPPNQCTFLNGYLIGYHYELLAPDHSIVENGDTTYTSATFYDLMPQSNYLMQIYIITSGGWNVYEKLAMNITTAATAPGRIQNLTVYKRGRRILGIRWAAPLNSYGEITAFTILCCRMNKNICSKENTISVAPVPCSPWPDFFCHTISSLVPNNKYSITVKARNIHVNEDGVPVMVAATTSEGVPEAPKSLRMIHRTSQSITLEWEPPTMFNGVLRSFLINVEQVESANATNCCVNYPIQEIPVPSEERIYTHEVKNLNPASKYVISISSKTISIGPSSIITVNTPPQAPELTEPPQMTGCKKVKIPKGKKFPGLVSTYLLLVLSPDSPPSPALWDVEVSERLQEIVNGSFHIVEEFRAEDMLTTQEVEIGTGTDAWNGSLGVLEDPELSSDFRVGLALVLDYSSAKNVSFIESKCLSRETLGERVIKVQCIETNCLDDVPKLENINCCK